MHTHTLPPRNPHRASPRPKDRITDNVIAFRHRLATIANNAALAADDEARNQDTLRPDYNIGPEYDLGPVKQMQRDHLVSVLIVAATVGACWAAVHFFA